MDGCILHRGDANGPVATARGSDTRLPTYAVYFLHELNVRFCRSTSAESLWLSGRHLFEEMAAMLSLAAEILVIVSPVRQSLTALSARLSRNPKRRQEHPTRAARAGTPPAGALQIPSPVGRGTKGEGLRQTYNKL